MKQLTSHIRRVLLLLILVPLTGCVTRNVYFPAPEAEHAADLIIDAVTNQPDGTTHRERDQAQMHNLGRRDSV